MPNFSNSPVISDYGFVALILIMTFGLSLLAVAVFLGASQRRISAPPA